MAAVQPVAPARIVGGLVCQKDSYLRTFDAKVVSCIPAAVSGEHVTSSKTKKKTADSLKNKDKPEATTPKWLIEFDDSVLFPEDHGTLVPVDNGSIEPIAIDFVERQGLRCKVHSPRPLTPGIVVRQTVDFDRRWDLMQQHTGQHLLSAIMNTYDDLKTLGWGMGSGNDMNYVDLPRKPTDDELLDIQNRANHVILQNVKITVETPDDANTEKLPDDYDEERGVVRVIRIGDLDNNTCCGTHLQQTSHIVLLLLGPNQSNSGGRCRQFFIAGDRALKLATSSLKSVRSISRLLSSGNTPDELLNHVTRLTDSVATLKSREAKLLSDIAKYETDRVKASLEADKSVFVHRPEPEMDFIRIVAASVKDNIKEGQVVILASGEGSSGGSIIVIGKSATVESYTNKVKEAFPSVKGGGKGERWQGKMTEWKSGDLQALQEMTES